MKLFLFFLFFLSFELVSAGFGVSPNKIIDAGEVYVINADEYETEYVLKPSEGVSISETSILVAAKGKEKIKIKTSEGGTVEIIEKKEGLSSSIIIPVESTASNIEFYAANDKSGGWLGVIGINVVGLCLVGVLKWKKKLF